MDNRFRHVLVWTAIFSMVGQVAQGQQSNVTTLSLQDVISRGLSNSTPVLQGQNAVALAGSQVLQAYGQLFLPNLQAGAGYNYAVGNNFYATEGPTLVRTDRGAFNYQLTSSINIFSGYNNLATWKAAQLNRNSASLSLAFAKESITEDLTQSYLQVVLDKKFVDLDSQNYVISTHRQDQIQALVDVGRRAKTDLYQQEAQTSQDHQLLLVSQNQLRSDKILLLRKLRLDSLDSYAFADLTIDDNPEVDQYGDEASLVRRALSDRVDIKASEMNTEVAQWYIKKYKSGYLPSVSFGAGLYDAGAFFNSLYVNGENVQPKYQESFGNQLYKQINGVFGVNATWTIFDKYYTKSNVQAAKINLDNARINLEDNKVLVVSQVRQAYGDYTTAIQQLHTAAQGLTAAQEAYDNISGRYQQGIANFIDLSNAQEVLLQAKQTAVQAAISIMLQKRILDYYTGHALK